MAGSTGYDIVVPTGSFLGRQIQAGIYQKIDKSKLKNYGNLDPQILEALKPFDPNNEYAVPYFWGTVGIGFNVDKVKERLGDSAPIGQLRSAVQAGERGEAAGLRHLHAGLSVGHLPPALKYLGKDPHSKSEEDYAAVEQMFAGGPAVREVLPLLAIHQRSGERRAVRRHRLVGRRVHRRRPVPRRRAATAELDYRIPKEGSLLWVDSLAIPKDAKNVDNALKFIDYLNDPQVAANGVNYVNYASPNTAALELIDPEMKDNPSIYPTDEVKENLFSDAPADPELDRMRTRIWTKIKTGQ